MTAVIWGDGVEVTSSENGAVAKTHQEFTINNWDELYDIDVSTCLQGSVVLNIPESKLAVWDGESTWYETDGTEHSGIPPVPELWKGFGFYDIYAEKGLPNGAVYNAYEGEQNGLIPSVEGVGDLAYNDFEATSSNPDVFTVQKEEVTEYGQTYCKVSFVPQVQKGTAVITFTFPDYPMFYGKLTVTIGGGNPADLYWYRLEEGVPVSQFYPEQAWTTGLSQILDIGAFTTEQTLGVLPVDSLPLQGYTEEQDAFYVSNITELGEHYVRIDTSSTTKGKGIVEFSIPSMDILAYMQITVADDGGK